MTEAASSRYRTPFFFKLMNGFSPFRRTTSLSRQSQPRSYFPTSIGGGKEGGGGVEGVDL